MSNSKKQKLAQHNWYMKNKKLTQKRTRISYKRYLKRNREFIRKLKEASPCIDCKLYYPWYVMDYDHRDTKKIAISQMIIHAYSLESIKREIEKSDLVCSNCHRIRTFTWTRKITK